MGPQHHFSGTTPFKICCAILASFLITSASICSGQGQPGDWAWMGGSQTVVLAPGQCPDSYAGDYGTEFEFSPQSEPSPRQGAVTWTGKNGFLYLFGGYGADEAGSCGALNDLWAFDPKQGEHGEWAWMGGGPFMNQAGQAPNYYEFADGNIPGARMWAGAAADPSGKVWLFGGEKVDEFDPYLNDLWVFDPGRGAHGEWARFFDVGPETCQNTYKCGRLATS
ncbi:MAG TPA: kelch repeat-containing protein, partial [Terracidiphilus sp.]